MKQKYKEVVQAVMVPFRDEAISDTNGNALDRYLMSLKLVSHTVRNMDIH